MQYRRRCSDCLRIEWPGVQISAEVRYFLVSKIAQTTTGVHPASCSMGTRDLCGVNRPGHVVGHFLPTSADVKNERSFNFTVPSLKRSPL